MEGLPTIYGGQPPPVHRSPAAPNRPRIPLIRELCGVLRDIHVAAAHDHAGPLALEPRARTAAKPKLPVGSTTIFMRVAKKRRHSMSSASVAVKIRLT